MKQIKKIEINSKVILALNLNKYSEENFLKFYKDFDGSLEDFFKLGKIYFNDKIFVALRLVDKNTQVKFAVKCAEFVLHIFEEKFKDDKRPRNCIEFLNSIDDFENLNDNQLELLQFHHDAASDASDAAEDYAHSYDYSDFDFDYDDAAYDASSAAYAVSAASVSAVSVADSSSAAFSSATFAAYDAADAAKRSNNTLKNHSTIFQFLIDLIK